MTEQLELAFHAPDAEDAMRQAREWVRAEPALRLRRVAKVRRDDRLPNTDRWIVTVAVNRVAEPA